MNKWHYDKDDERCPIKDEEGKPIIAAVCEYDDIVIDALPEHLKLIAAAPEMLELLKDTLCGLEIEGYDEDNDTHVFVRIIKLRQLLFKIGDQ